MKLREFISLNQNITDLEIYVREGGNKLVDYLAIGLDAGVKPPYPMKIHPGTKGEKEGKYIHKPINAWDDGQSYWEVKVNRIPEKWLDLEVFSFCNRHCYLGHHPRYGFNPCAAYEKYEVVVLPSGEILEIKQEKKTVPVEEQLPGQTSIYDFIGV